MDWRAIVFTILFVPVEAAVWLLLEGVPRWVLAATVAIGTMAMLSLTAAGWLPEYRDTLDGVSLVLTVAYALLLLYVVVGPIPGGRDRAASSTDTAVLDELAHLAAEAETAVTRTQWYADDVEEGMNAVRAFAAAAKARQGQLRESTNRVIVRYGTTIDQAIYSLSQMPPGALAGYGDDHSAAMLRARHGLIQRVLDGRQLLVRHFQALRGIVKDNRRPCRWRRAPRLKVTAAPTTEGTEVVLNVQNKGGRAVVRAWVQPLLSRRVPYPLRWKQSSDTAVTIASGGGAESVLAKTEEWSGFVSTHVVDTGQQITLLTGDGTDAIRRQLWHLKQDEKNYYGPSLNPTIRISVTFETEPSLPEVFRTSFVIKTTVIDGQPRLMIEQADS